MVLTSYDNTTTGSVRIGGLPFPAYGVTTRFPYTVQAEGITTTLAVQAVSHNNDTFVRLKTPVTDGGSIELSQTEPTDTTAFYISGRYRVDV